MKGAHLFVNRPSDIVSLFSESTNDQCFIETNLTHQKIIRMDNVDVIRAQRVGRKMSLVECNDAMSATADSSGQDVPILLMI